MKPFLLIVAAFVSYCVGRIGHVFGGQLAGFPHHWIYGVLMIIIGLIFRNKFWGKVLFAAGIGMIISDLFDVLRFRFFGVDDVEVVRFWGID